MGSTISHIHKVAPKPVGAAPSKTSPTIPAHPADATPTGILGTFLETEKSVNISDWQNHSYMEMIAGIKAADVDPEYSSSFAPVSGQAYVDALNKYFDPTKAQKIISESGGQQALIAAIDSLSGKMESAGDLYMALAGVTPALPKGALGDIASSLPLVCGRGTHIQIGNKVLVLDSGYADPTAKFPPNVQAVMTGRSFAADTMGRLAIDPSDSYYLGENKKIFGQGTNPGNFFGPLMDVLVKCDTTQLDALADASDCAAIGDFLAVFAAEGDRNEMDPTGKTHQWQKDLFHATCLGSFVAAAGGDPGAFWAMSSASKRSGIGITKNARIALEHQLCEAQKENDPEIFNRLQAVLQKIPKATYVYNSSMGPDDLISQLCDAMGSNDPDVVKAVQANAAELSAAAAAFMDSIHDDAAKLVAAGVPKGISSGASGSPTADLFEAPVGRKAGMPKLSA